MTNAQLPDKPAHMQQVTKKTYSVPTIIVSAFGNGGDAVGNPPTGNAIDPVVRQNNGCSAGMAELNNP